MTEVCSEDGKKKSWCRTWPVSWQLYNKFVQIL